MPLVDADKMKGHDLSGTPPLKKSGVKGEVASRRSTRCHGDLRLNSLRECEIAPVSLLGPLLLSTSNAGHSRSQTNCLGSSEGGNRTP